MIKSNEKRVTYAQEKLLKLIEERKLKKWCTENALSHTSVYRLAVGETLPTYRIVSSMTHLIPPIEWLFFTDEELPYEPQSIPQWDYRKNSKFIKEHRFDYKIIGEKYGLEELSSYNLLVAYRAYPTMQFIRNACKDVNPIDFFIDAEIEIPKTFIPDRADIVNVENSLLLVLSKKEFNEKHNSITGCKIISEATGDDIIPLTNTSLKGFVKITDLNSYNFNFSNINAGLPYLIEKAEINIVEKVLVKVTEIFK